MKYLLITLYVCFYTLKPAYGQSWKKELDIALTKLNEEGLFEGQVLLSQGEQIKFYKHYEGKKAYTLQTPIALASVTKPITAIAIMLLEENGQLSYEDKLQKYFPALPYPEVRVRHLLQQTSGLPWFLETARNHADVSRPLYNEGLFELIALYKPEGGTPGVNFQYNNDNYNLLGAIIEKVTGEKYSEYLRKSIWKPLGMLSMTDLTADKIIGKTNADNFLRTTGGGNLAGTAHDLFKLDMALRQNKLLSRETMEKAYTPPLLPDSSRSPYGFGWFIHTDGEKKVAGHRGSGESETVWYRELDTQRTVILLDNNGLYFDAIFEVVLSIRDGKPYTLPVKREVHDIDKRLYQYYTGTYTSPYGTVHVTEEGGKLYLRPDAIPDKEELVPESDTTFYFKGQDLKWQVYKNEQGEVIGFGIAGDRQNMGKKIE